MNRVSYLAYIVFVLLAGALFSCEEKMTQEEITQIGIASCRSLAPFVKKVGFDVSRSGFSTNERNIKGIALVQFPVDPADTTDKKVWQDPSWQKFGWMGSITTDNHGAAYTAPLPKVNTFDNPLSQMNRIYRIDPQTGEMKVFAVLPAADTTSGVVSFAVLGVYYDCHANKLYASSVAGSKREEEKGVIYVIDPATGAIEDQLEGHDAMAVFVGGVTGEKRLYFGSTRTSDIYSIELSKSGKFKGDARKEFTLEQLGPRGDDKARRIRFDQQGNMLVYGVEFNYSLAAQSNKPETVYNFGYDKQNEKWVVIENQ
jgi:hypothetical protein